MDAIDWGKIRAEYVSGLSSYRALADKYGVSRTEVNRHGKEGGWVEARRKFLAKADAKTEELLSDKKAQRMAKAMDASDLLMDKLVEIAQAMSQRSSAKALHELSGTLKDLMAIQDLRSDADIREQEARIDRLRKEIDRDNADNSVTLTISGGGDDGWAE